jgi:hypothetical protein
MFLACVLDLLGADLVLDLRIDEHLLRNGVTDELDGHVLGQLLAPLPVLFRGRPAQRLELGEHLLHLAVVVLQDRDHVTLLLGHGCLLGDRPTDALSPRSAGSRT